LILGFLTFLAPSLENEGFSPTVAGIVVGLYGVAVLCWTRAVKLVSNRLGAAALILIGGGMLALGYAWSAAGHSLVGVGIAAVLVGGGSPSCTPRFRPGLPRSCRRHVPQ
jgi:hypothetical protein